MDSLLCPWGKKVLTFSLIINSTLLIWIPINTDTFYASLSVLINEVWFLGHFPFLTGPAEQFLKCGGRWPPTLRWGGGGEEQIWLFSLCGCLELSDYWTFLESLLSGVMFINLKQLKSIFLLLSLIAHAGSTTRSLQIMILLCRFL